MSVSALATQGQGDDRIEQARCTQAALNATYCSYLVKYSNATSDLQLNKLQRRVAELEDENAVLKKGRGPIAAEPAADKLGRSGVSSADPNFKDLWANPLSQELTLKNQELRGALSRCIPAFCKSCFQIFCLMENCSRP